MTLDELKEEQDRAAAKKAGKASLGTEHSFPDEPGPVKFIECPECKQNLLDSSCNCWDYDGDPSWRGIGNMGF